MADNDLQINLTLNDQATKQANAALNDINKTANDLGKSSQKATDGIEAGFKKAHVQLREFHAALLVSTIAFTTAGIAVNEWGKLNTQTRSSLDQISTAMKSLTANIGSIFAPTVVAFAELIKSSTQTLSNMLNTVKEGYEAIFKSISFGTQFLVAFFTEMKAGVSITNAFKDATQIAKMASEQMADQFKASMTQNIASTDEATIKLKEMADGLNNIATLFKAGEISAKQYYDVITSGDAAAYQAAQLRLQAMNELAAEENLIRNQGLMDDQANTAAHINLLKTLQSYHHTVYSTMQDFQKLVITQFSSGMATALTAVITGTQKASEAFKAFGLSMITSIVQFVIEYGIQMLIAAALSKVIMAQTVAQASVIAAAWEPAAIFAAVATLGAAGAAGAAGLGVATAAATGIAAMGKFGGFGGGQTGGKGATGSWYQGTPNVPGFDSGTDTVPAMVSPGEMIFPRTMADAIRSGEISVGGPGGSAGGDVNIFMSGVTINSKDSVRELAEELGFEIQRRSRSARSSI